MAGFRPSQVVIGIAGELVKGFTTTLTQERKQARAADHRRRARASSSTPSSARRSRRPSARSPGRPACRSVDVRLVHSAIVGASIDGYGAHQPGRLPGPARQDRDLQRVRAARPPRRAPDRREPAGPRAARDRRGAVRRRAGPRARSRSARRARCSSTSAAARPTSRSCARAASRGRACSRSAAGRSRSRSPTASTCRSRAPRRSRSTTRGASTCPSAAQVGAIVGDDVAVWAAGVELVMEELAGGRDAAVADLPVRRRLAPARDPRRAGRGARSGSGCRSPGRPRWRSWRPTRSRRSATRPSCSSTSRT